LRQKDISLIEGGHWQPSLRILTRLAQSLDVSIQFFINGQNRPAENDNNLTLELRDLGIIDLSVAGSRVPGAFREKEHILALSLAGDAPDPRVVDALPRVLWHHQWEAVLFAAYAHRFDQRAIYRAAWLIEIGKILQDQLSDTGHHAIEASLEAIVKLARKPDEPDSLGYPADEKTILRPVYKRWNITYATSIEGFASRWTLLDELSQ